MPDLSPGENENFHHSPFYKMLKEHFPEYRTSQDMFDVKAFGAALDVSGELVYRWLRKGSIKPHYAKKIVDLSLANRHKKPLTTMDFHDLVFA